MSPKTANHIEEQMLASAYLHMDETRVQVLKGEGKTAQSQSYMWVRCAGPPGAWMADGYGGYASVCEQQALTRLGCWAHARRKFVEAVKVLGGNKQGRQKKPSKAAYAIKLIAKLDAIEKQMEQKRSEYAHIDDFNIERHTQRQHRSKPVIEKLRKWLTDTRPKVASKLKLGEALTYLHHQWPHLVAYLEDGAYPIDNNPVEKAIRPFVIGLKNWMFSTSVNGVKASANLYSLIETAKANGLEPYAYLKQVFSDLPNVVNYDDVDLLLPENIKKGVA